VRERFGIRDIIDRDELQIAIIQRCPKRISTDATKSIDRSLNRHNSLLLLKGTNRRLLFQ
jgi:hypothetical protein